MTTPNSTRSCGIWALSEVLDLSYESQMQRFYTTAREETQADMEPTGALPLELHEWAWELGFPNQLWIPPPKKFKGKLHIMSLEDVFQHGADGKALLGVVSEVTGSGHWVPVRYGLFKEKRYLPWQPLGDLLGGRWDSVNVAILFK